MKKKLAFIVLALGFTVAPSVAFADSLVINQGGTPTYSCPQGSDLVGDKCITPAHDEVTPEVRNPAEATTTTNQVWEAGANSWAAIHSFEGRGCQGAFFAGGFTMALCPVTQTSYSCPETSSLVGTDCVIPEKVTTIEASTTPATISGSQGGSLVANVSSIFAPVWDFIWRFLPLIAGLVTLGLFFGLAHRAAQKRANAIQ